MGRGAPWAPDRIPGFDLGEGFGMLRAMSKPAHHGRLEWFWLCGALVACGGGPQARPQNEPVLSPAESASVAPEIAEGEAASTEAETPEQTPVTEAEAVAEPPAPAPQPPPAPLTPSSAEDVHEALRAAASDVEALRRLIDPRWGIGAYDPEDSGVVHHCALERLASLSGLGFVIGESDRFRCDPNLRRCSSADADDRGYVFLLRPGEGDVMWLNAVVQYPRRVPRTDPAAVRAFGATGDGVCDLWRSFTESDSSAPRRFSVFVSSYTGLVPETLSEHHCAEDAAAAYTERLAPVLGRPPSRCERNPTRCAFSLGDEEVTVYGDADGPSAVAVTRPSMHQDLDRSQRRELEAFVAGVARHRCAE